MTDPLDECGDEATCDWNPRYSPRWEAAVDAAPWQGDIKILDCPRCHHPMTVIAGATTTDAVREMSEVVDEPSVSIPLDDLARRIEANDELIGARCDCRIEHDGHPQEPKDRVWGCGQAGAIHASK